MGVASSAWAGPKNLALSRDLSTLLLIFLETPQCVRYRQRDYNSVTTTTYVPSLVRSQCARTVNVYRTDVSTSVCEFVYY